MRNPSFEDTVYCPNSAGDISAARYWNNPQPLSGSSDYFNSCAQVPTGMGVPSNFGGNAFAVDGSAYTGFATFCPFCPGLSSEYREYIQSQLVDSLSANHRYCVTAYVRLADSSDFATSQIGFCFTSAPIQSFWDTVLHVIPNVENTDSSGVASKGVWTRLSGAFFATGGERYITIGNFRTNASTSFYYVGNGSAVVDYAYYYIDSITVVDCTPPDTTHPPPVPNYSIMLTPNPNNGNVILSYTLPSDGRIEIYNMLGQIVYKESLPSGSIQHPLNLIRLSTGAYSYRVYDQTTELKHDRFIISR